MENRCINKEEPFLDLKLLEAHKKPIKRWAEDMGER